MAYKRWYDQDPRLSAVVHAMENMGDATQQTFADKLLMLSELLLEEKGETYKAMVLDAQKQQGLQKAEARNRWYDRYESLHQAFNNLYILYPEDRRDVALRLEVPIQIVEGYEKHCLRTDKAADPKVIEEVLRTALVDGQARAKRLYSLYMVDYDEMMSAIRPRSKSEQGEQTERGMWARFLTAVQSALAAA